MNRRTLPCSCISVGTAPNQRQGSIYSGQPLRLLHWVRIIWLLHLAWALGVCSCWLAEVFQTRWFGTVSRAYAPVGGESLFSGYGYVDEPCQHTRQPFSGALIHACCETMPLAISSACVRLYVGSAGRRVWGTLSRWCSDPKVWQSARVPGWSEPFDRTGC